MAMAYRLYASGLVSRLEGLLSNSVVGPEDSDELRGAFADVFLRLEPSMVLFDADELDAALDSLDVLRDGIAGGQIVVLESATATGTPRRDAINAGIAHSTPP